MTTRSNLALTVQVASREPALPSRAALRRWAAAALDRDARITVRIVDEAEGRRLNRDFRGKDAATNVLAFGYDQVDRLSGDIVLCAPVVAVEARAQGKRLEAHYAHLIVHAMLHLQGHDHARDEEAARMEARETEIVTQLGYPDPYQAAA
jgi:probable rRNA maturation factor